jgi:hypothetical protein
MLKPGKYMRSKMNDQLFIFDPRDLIHDHMEVVYVDANGKVTVDGEQPAIEEPQEAQADPVDGLSKKELSDLYTKKYGRKPHPGMRIERLRQSAKDNGNDTGEDDSQ